MSQPGQPHISQAVGGEVVEVGQGGQVQEDQLGQVVDDGEDGFGEDGDGEDGVGEDGAGEDSDG